jgi:Na+/H+-dicarboxylate symporter
MAPQDWLSLLAISYFTTKAAPPVPRASLVLIAAVVSGFGIPPAVAAPVIGLLVSADVLFDMSRTLVNNIGHVGIAAALERKSGDDLL